MCNCNCNDQRRRKRGGKNPHDTASKEKARGCRALVSPKFFPLRGILFLFAGKKKLLIATASLSFVPPSWLPPPREMPINAQNRSRKD